MDVPAISDGLGKIEFPDTCLSLTLKLMSISTTAYKAVAYFLVAAELLKF